MRTLIVALAVSVASAAFAHDSTVPHLHPHGHSLLPDYAAMLLAAALVAAIVMVVRIKRNIK